MCAWGDKFYSSYVTKTVKHFVNHIQQIVSSEEPFQRKHICFLPFPTLEFLPI